MNQLLETILREWEVRPLPMALSREVSIDLKEIESLKNKALVVTGFRRVGKTYLLFEAINKLLKTYSRKELIYINFEDERLPRETAILTDLLPSIQAVFGQKPQYLFLDELQNIPDWSRWARRILDTENIKLILTGSSSKMSSYEIPTELRGRFWEKTIHPLSFKEFLQFKKEKISILTSEGQARQEFLFREYLLNGGLPEIVLESEDRKRELLQGYFQTVIKKDICERFGIRSEETVKTVLKLLLNSSYITISKLYRDLKSIGIAVGKTSLNHYLSYFESSYLLKTLLFYSPSMRNQLQYPRKIYFIDNGFLTALSTNFSPNYGRLLENLVYWHLAKDAEKLYYFRDNLGEVDFVEMGLTGIKTLYQVCWNLEEKETREREISSLKRAGRKLNCQDLRLITLGTKPLIDVDGVEVVDFLNF